MIEYIVLGLVCVFSYAPIAIVAAKVMLALATPSIPRARVIDKSWRPRCSRCGETYNPRLDRCLCTWCRFD